MLKDTDIEQRFGFHKAAIEGGNVTNNEHKDLRIQFKSMAAELNNRLPEGRAKSIALTELESASMWAHKALAQQNPLVEE